jgi:hypothetical protein
MNFPYHPAPGLGNGGSLPAGFHIIPNSPEGMRQHGVQRVKGIADIIPGSYTIPENPITGYLTGNVKALGTSGGCGCSSGKSCGCGGKLNGMAVQGMGQCSDFSTFTSALGSGNFGGALTDTICGVPAWVYLGGLAFLLFADFGKGSAAVRGKRAARAAASAY